MAPQSPEVPEQVQPLVERAMADAATQTGIAAEQWHVTRIEAVTWSDSSLGCPKPGYGYAQALVPGFLFVIEAGNKALEYHTGWNSVVCAGTPRTITPPRDRGMGGATGLGL